MLLRDFVIVLLLYGLVILVRSDSVAFHDCGSLYYLDEVYIDGCSSLPCVFTRGSRQNFTFTLYAEFESNTFSQNAVFVYRGIRYPLEVDPTALCGKSLHCPVKEGANASFTSYLTVNESLPSTSMTGELYWTTQNENSEVIVCMKTNVMVSV